MEGLETINYMGKGSLDEIQGGTENDRIWGYEGDDNLDGGDGNDYLSGSDGNDTLITESVMTNSMVAMTTY